jgi:hypothetical protein
MHSKTSSDTIINNIHHHQQKQQQAAPALLVARVRTCKSFNTGNGFQMHNNTFSVTLHTFYSIIPTNIIRSGVIASWHGCIMCADAYECNSQAAILHATTTACRKQQQQQQQRTTICQMIQSTCAACLHFLSRSRGKACISSSLVKLAATQHNTCHLIQ